MKIFVKLLIVIMALFLELAALEIGAEMFFGRSHGMMVDVRYRRTERIAAFFDYQGHPSAETKAKFEEEMRLMHRHEDWKAYLTISLFFAVNGIWIFYYFRGRKQSDIAPEPIPG